LAASAVEIKTLRFERLAKSHLPAVLEIEKEANASPWSEKAFENEIDHPHGVFLVAIANGEVSGYGGVWLVVDEAHITTVAVKSNLRRAGIGRKLVERLLEDAKEAGMTCATLEVRAGNEAAIGLYEAMGFRTIARRKGYYPNNKEDALVMWLEDLAAWKP